MFDVYNISNKRKIKVEYIIKMIQNKIPEVTVEYISRTPGDQFGIYGENEKAKKNLLWEPYVSFEDGMNIFYWLWFK